MPAHKKKKPFDPLQSNFLNCVCKTIPPLCSRWPVHPACQQQQQQHTLMRAFRWRFPIIQYYHHHPLILQGGAPFLACFGGGENVQKKTVKDRWFMRSLPVLCVRRCGACPRALNLKMQSIRIVLASPEGVLFPCGSRASSANCSSGSSSSTARCTN